MTHSGNEKKGAAGTRPAPVDPDLSKRAAAEQETEQRADIAQAVEFISLASKVRNAVIAKTGLELSPRETDVLSRALKHLSSGYVEARDKLRAAGLR